MGTTPASAAATAPPSPRARPQLRRPAMQRLGGRGRFQIGFPIFGLTGYGFNYIWTFLQNYICTDSTSLNSGRREYMVSR
jgi:hypothetical protein